jgi:hypothetical protein
LPADDTPSQDPLPDWSHEESVITSLTLTVPEQYLAASSEDVGASNQARASLTDQYGSAAGGGEVITERH